MTATPGRSASFIRVSTATQFTSLPAPVEYSLTEYGQSLLPLVEHIRLWGRAHLEHLTSQTGTPASDP